MRFITMHRCTKFFSFFASVGIYIVLFYSIFDIYYTSPLTKGLRPTALNISPPATHLIFIVADGLRADKLFTDNMEDTPFLKNLLLEHAAWGLSHTRVPTESRPGHVAMLGGFYEDVASITKGWQANAVEFDSLFNRTLRGWAWGTDEVVQLFSHGRPNAVRIESSPKELSDLKKHNMTEIDTWTVDRFLDCLRDKESGFFSTKSVNPPDPDLTRRGHLAFLHLDAADHIGHSYKPSSIEYRDMMHHLDGLIYRVVKAVNESQGSNRVAFVFTADHGMTEWGSHGAGSLHETVTPLLVWGAGLVGPKVPSITLNSNAKDQYGLPVHNYGRQRRELRQADICPLMAAILGVPIPSNSVGRVPLQFLALNDSDRAQLVRSNCIQILNQLREKRAEKSNYHLFFKEYKFLTNVETESRVKSNQLLLDEGKFSEAIIQYEKLTDLAHEALNYYNKYDRLYLGICIVAIFALWSLVILTTLVQSGSTIEGTSGADSKARIVIIWLCSVFGTLLACVLLVWAYLQPVTHTVYQVVPVLLFLCLTCSADRRHRLYLLYDRSKSLLFESGTGFICLVGLVVIALLELMIWGFLYRPLLSLACLIVAMWPVFDHSFGSNRAHLRRLWSVACVTLAVFPLLPVIGSTFNPFLVCTSALFTAAVCYSTFQRLCTLKQPNPGRSTHWRVSFAGFFLTFCIIIAGFSVYGMHGSYSAVLQNPIHIFSWSALIFPPLVVLSCVPPRLGLRTLAWISVFVTLLILLSTHYEILFMLVFLMVGLLWIQLEASGGTTVWSINTVLESDHASVVHKLTNSSQSNTDLLTISNFRQSVFFIFLLVLSFFGTGNIASVNSFDPRSTFCFVTNLEPALMGLLLLVKVLCPMICLGVIYAAVQLANAHTKSDTPLYAHTQDAISAQTGLSAIMSNFIAIHFFAWLRDEGSWLEIGNSISHYVIAMAFGLAAFLFSLFGRKMLTFNINWIFGHTEAGWRKYI